MQYTVEQLIKKLKKLPKNAIINLRDVGTDEIFETLDIEEDTEDSIPIVTIKFNADVDDETDDDDDE